MGSGRSLIANFPGFSRTAAFINITSKQSNQFERWELQPLLVELKSIGVVEKRKAFVCERRRLFFTIDKAFNPKHPG
jgi:hypothetical protein